MKVGYMADDIGRLLAQSIVPVQGSKPGTKSAHLHPFAEPLHAIGRLKKGFYNGTNKYKK